MNIATECLVNELEKRILPDKKTILYVGIKYDYGRMDWGLSYEHHNFYQTFINMGYSMINFDYFTLYHQFGAEVVSKMLDEAVYYYNPDLVFYFHYKDWINHNTWSQIPVKKYIWLADDSWRYDETEPVWKLFDTIITTDTLSHEKRQKAGYNSVLSEWGCNHLLYRDVGMRRIYDVSFVGRAHGERKEFIEALMKHGIPVKCFGEGWEGSSRISQTDLIKIYNKSKIVINMSRASTGGKIKVNGRDFEATGCGAMLLTQYSPAIGECFDSGYEIAIYIDVETAVKTIKYYLKETALREMIAEAGYDRTLTDHTYVKRLQEIIQ